MRRDQLLLAEIRASIERIIELTAGGDADELGRDRDRRDALLWNFTVLGEAVSQLSDETKITMPEVEWRDPVRLRNRIVHGYWSADLDVLLTTAKEDLPVMLGLLQSAGEAPASDA